MEKVKVILVEREADGESIVFAETSLDNWYALKGGTKLNENSQEVVPKSLYDNFIKGLKAL